MTTPDPEGMTLLAKVIAAGSAVGAPIIWLWAKLDRKADKHSVNNQMQEVKGEQALHRTYFKDVFKAMEDHARRDETLFREMMGTMASNHSELLRELNKKADRK